MGNANTYLEFTVSKPGIYNVTLRMKKDGIIVDCIYLTTNINIYPAGTLSDVRSIINDRNYWTVSFIQISTDFPKPIGIGM